VSRLRKCLRARHSAQREHVAHASKRIRAAPHRSCETIARRRIVIQKSACAAIVSFINASRVLQRLCFQLDRHRREKWRFADSESQILATKIFSGKFAFCAIAARNGELFRSFCETDSQTDSGSRDVFEDAYRDRTFVIVPKNGKRTDLTDAAKERRRARRRRRVNDVQMPSFALSRSLTACGLALPPVAFMT